MVSHLIESEPIDVEMGMDALELLSASRRNPARDWHTQIEPEALSWAIRKRRMDAIRLRAACKAGDFDPTGGRLP